MISCREIVGNNADVRKEKITLRMVASGLISGVTAPITALAMEPDRSTKDLLGELLAIGNIFSNYNVHVCI